MLELSRDHVNDLHGLYSESFDKTSANTVIRIMSLIAVCFLIFSYSSNRFVMDNVVLETYNYSNKNPKTNDIINISSENLLFETKTHGKTPVFVFFKVKNNEINNQKNANIKVEVIKYGDSDRVECVENRVFFGMKYLKNKNPLIFFDMSSFCRFDISFISNINLKNSELLIEFYFYYFRDAINFNYWLYGVLMIIFISVLFFVLCFKKKLFFNFTLRNIMILLIFFFSVLLNLIYNNDFLKENMYRSIFAGVLNLILILNYSMKVFHYNIKLYLKYFKFLILAFTLGVTYIHLVFMYSISCFTYPSFSTNYYSNESIFLIYSYVSPVILFMVKLFKITQPHFVVPNYKIYITFLLDFAIYLFVYLFHIYIFSLIALSNDVMNFVLKNFLQCFVLNIATIYELLILLYFSSYAIENSKDFDALLKSKNEKVGDVFTSSDSSESDIEEKLSRVFKN